MAITSLSILGAIGLSIFSQVAIMQEQAQAGTLAPPPVSVSGGGGAANPGSTLPVNTSAGKGAQIFAANCSGCHGAAGQGTPGAFPPLAKNPYVTGDPKALLHTLSYGLTGSITVNGQSYNGQMPTWKGTLTNADIADVATYIRSAWGNKAGKITEKQVASVKK